MDRYPPLVNVVIYHDSPFVVCLLSLNHIVWCQRQLQPACLLVAKSLFQRVAGGSDSTFSAYLSIVGGNNCLITPSPSLLLSSPQINHASLNIRLEPRKLTPPLFKGLLPFVATCSRVTHDGVISVGLSTFVPP